VEKEDTISRGETITAIAAILRTTAQERQYKFTKHLPFRDYRLLAQKYKASRNDICVLVLLSKVFPLFFFGPVLLSAAFYT
jgi:hypothetical protein